MGTVKLTEKGLRRFREARQRFDLTNETISHLDFAPARGIVGKVFNNTGVSQSSVERTWNALQEFGRTRKIELASLIEGEDFYEILGEADSNHKKLQAPGQARSEGGRKGWRSRHSPVRSSHFTGRREILDALHERLKQGPVALSGLPGIGKTQTAVAYVHEFASHYHHILWIYAETVEDLQSGLTGLAEELKLVRAGQTTQQVAAEAMRDWLDQQSGWLLVLDNVDDLDSLAPHFPPHRNGSLLLTTRSGNIISEIFHLPIARFAEEEGALVLLRRSGELDLGQPITEAPADVRQAAIDLSREVDGLPLALEQAGAYIRKARMTVPEYLAAYRAHGLQLLEIGAEPDRRSVVVTYSLALDKLAHTGKYGQAAVDLIHLCAFLAPDLIPEAIFTVGYSDLEYLQIRTAALAYSLVNRDPKTATLSIHRLVQEAVRLELGKACGAWAQRAVHCVAQTTPDFEFEQWDRCALLLPHWRVCARHIETEGVETVEAAELLFQAARWLHVRAEYTEAEALFLRALAIFEKATGIDGSDTGGCLDGLAALCRDIGDYQRAEALYRRALDISRTIHGPEDPETAIVMYNLAIVYADTEKYADAETLFRDALTIFERHGQDNLQIAHTMTQLAAVYRYQQRYADAGPLYRGALEMFDRLLDRMHISRSVGLNNLGTQYLNQNRYAEAKVLFMEALMIKEAVQGKDHPGTATTLWGLANVYWKQNRIAEAHPLFERVRASFDKHLGKRHPKHVKFLNQYAEFLEDTGKQDEAIEMRTMAAVHERAGQPAD